MSRISHEICFSSCALCTLCGENVFINLESDMPEPVVIATWPFGKTAVETALPLVAAGKPVLDAVIAGAQAVESDPGVRSVGFGSLPDRIGRLTLDSCVMDGKTLSCGAVAGLEHVRSASAVARLVMDKTPHVLLVGEGAKWFALQNGFTLEMPHTLEGMREWFEKHPKAKKQAEKDGKPQPAFQGPEDLTLPIDESNHDTVTVLGVDGAGRLGGVCTTSGLAYKLPGRVGDSPIIGAGLYVDDEAGRGRLDGRRRGGHPHRRQPVRGRADARRQDAAGSLRTRGEAGQPRGRAPRHAPADGGLPGGQPQGRSRRGGDPAVELRLRGRPRRQDRDAHGQGAGAGRLTAYQSCGCRTCLSWSKPGLTGAGISTVGPLGSRMRGRAWYRR